MIITNFEVVGQNGEIQQTVLIDDENGTVTSMPKWKWDELQAAKENGTIS